MSIQKETVQVFAQELGYPRLKEDIAQTLSTELEQRIREIIQEAQKFMKHSRRKTLECSDINHALSVKNIEPVYGYKTRVDQKSHLFRRVPSKKTLYYLVDNEIAIRDALSTPLPKVPLGPSIGAHWLAIEGVQPKIPFNPLVPEKEEKVEETSSTTEVKPLVKHVLSSELMLYYERVVTTIQTSNVNDSLASDAGIQMLVPYFTQFVSEQVTANLKKLSYLSRLMHMVWCLLSNQNLNLEFYLHQLIPPILTCLVARRLSETGRENHWALRDTAAELISFICLKYGPQYSTLYKRITKSLLHALLDPNKPRATHYGAIIGIHALGIQSCQLLLLNPVGNSNLKAFYQYLEPELSSSDIQKKSDALMCYHALLGASTYFLKSVGKKDEIISRSLPDDIATSYGEMYEMFGESIMPYVPFGGEWLLV